ncbi:hypothetical protein DPMN_043900 [Dreissena polymorpha]|uniref:Uncharacterized protein n=1 Tax=Dreissena polymorpha TaxID=45954 RepID=A0A9D4HYE8_DREPO|nr:hypothetical protein DPMN_043900 [Dreissena polymorpha]
MVLKSFNDIETDIGRIVDQMVCDVGKVLNSKHGFGLKLYADIGFFGMQFVGMDVDMVFGTSRELEQCNKYEFVHTFTSDENVVRILGVGKVMVKLGRFLLAHGGLGVGVSLSLDNTLKFYIIFRAEASLLGLKSSVEVHIGTSGLHFFMEGNIWNIYKAKLRVSKELFLNLKNCREISLEGMALKVKGQFVADADGDGDFSDGYVHALIRFTERFRDETIDRLSDVQNAFTEAQRGLTSAQNWLESQKAVVRSAHKDFDDAVRSMEVAKVKLEEAKKPFQNAIDRLNEAQRKVDRLCRIKTCQNICIPGIECRIRNYNVLGAQFRFPCCSPTNCMFTIPDIICELANVGCYIVRGLAYAVLEIAKIAVRIPMLILDAAKVIVSAAQVFVDKSRVVLDIAEGAISFAQLGLEGAKWVLEGAKYALEAVKVVVKLGVMDR